MAGKSNVVESRAVGAPITAGQSAGHNIFVLANIVAGGYFERAEKPFGLSLTQWTVLRAVVLEPGLAQADIAAACGLNTMNVSRAVGVLRKKGLVDAADDERNPRRKLLTASELGASIGADLAARERLLYDHVFAELPADELEQLDGVIARIITRLAEHPPPDPPSPSRDWRAVLEEAENRGSERNQQKSGART